MTPGPDTPSSDDRAASATAGRMGDRLDGWKAIAGYLGRDIRTVQRWELSEGLPVHRLEHKQRSSAYAFTAELDDWVARRAPADGALGAEVSPAAESVSSAGQMRRARHRRPRVLVGALVALAAAGLAIWALATWRTTAANPGAHGDTRDPEAYTAFAKGQALYLSRQYREAAISLERAVTRDPQYGIAWAWLGKAYGRLAQPVWGGGPAAAERATDAANRAASLSPNSADAHVALALAARGRGEVEGWRSEARKAIELDPRAAEALALLGDSYSTVVYSCNVDQDAELAESYYERAMELMPSLTTTASNRAGNLRRLGRYTECVDLLNRTMRDYPDETPLRAVRGACRLMQGDIEGATEDITPLRNNPRIAAGGSLVYLGLLALKTGRTEEGIRDLEAFTQFDRSARAELIVAEVYGLAGDIGRASAHITRAISLDATCARFVANSLGFKPVHGHPAIEALLAGHDVRSR